MFRKGKSAVEGDPMKSWSEKEEVGLETSLVRSAEKEVASHLLGLRGTHLYSDQRFSRIRAPCVARDRVGGGPNSQIVSIKRAADGRRQRTGKIIDEEREKYRAKNRSLRNTSTDSKGTTFVILINHASAPIREERLSPTSKARREASRDKFVEKDGVPDRVGSLRKVDRSKNRKLAWLGFVKPIRNGLSKEQSLIKSRPSRTETGLAGRKNKVRPQKEE